MSVPKSRKSRSSVRRRRSHHHLNPIGTGTCGKCQAPVLSHQACAQCGFYKGRQVIDHTRDALRQVVKQQPHAGHSHDEPAKEIEKSLPVSKADSKDADKKITPNKKAA